MEPVPDARVRFHQGADRQFKDLPGLAVVARSLAGTQVMVERDDYSISTQEGDVQGLLHAEHVYGLAGLQKHALTGSQGRGPEQAFQSRPRCIRNYDAVPQGDIGPGDVSHYHIRH
jgi:hypothetical protein